MTSHHWSLGFRLLFALVFVAHVVSDARIAGPAQKSDLPEPAHCLGFHSIGNLPTIVTPGVIARWSYLNAADLPSCQIGTYNASFTGYPRGSRLEYLFGVDFWLGGVIGRDTLVSTAFFVSGTGMFDNWLEKEWYADEAPFGLMHRRSTLDTSSSLYGNAISEEDFVVVYTDTYVSGLEGLAPDYFNDRPHRPLHVEITQESYAWSYGYAEDFILFNLTLKNIGEKPIEDAYFGLSFDAFATFVPGIGLPPEIGDFDDLGGFLLSWPSAKDCGLDTLSAAWFADNDGDPVDGEWSRGQIPWRSCTSVEGIRFLNQPQTFTRLAYNWWVHNYNNTLDFGPRAQPTNGRPFRNFNTGGIGTPQGDVNKYYQMSNQEIDYDQFRTASITSGDPAWIYPLQSVAENIADGEDANYLLSFGPFGLEPGESLPVVFALVAGEHFHRDPNNLQRLLDGNPDEYYAHLDFTDFAKNAMWAQWIYDNPGVDTDNDGYSGDFRVCVIDSELIGGNWVPSVAETTYYRGDGVPDWRAAGPPPAPRVWLERRLNGIRVRFNGQASETTKDIFTQIIDFEGYRVYFGRDARKESLSLLASYDIEDFDKFVYDPQLYPSGGYRIQSAPMSLQEIRCRYSRAPDPCNDLTFDPLFYSPGNPYVNPAFPDSAFYFAKHDANASLLGVATPIIKVYPNQSLPEPGDTLNPEALTPDGYLKYYEYEFTIEGLLPTVPYYANVTAFDFGSPESGLSVLESSPTLNIQSVYPASDPGQVTGERRPVYIYPNPYRADGGYRPRGYEGRHLDNVISDRLRLLHFENLPPKCTIRIFSLDGDLVKEIRHDFEPGDPNHTHDTWNLINRNTQAVVSGIYFWSVEEPSGHTQMGKLVIIK